MIGTACSPERAQSLHKPSRYILRWRLLELEHAAVNTH